MSLDKLRETLAPLVLALKDSINHRDLAELCARLGLPAPLPEGAASKWDRLKASFDAAEDADLPRIAERYIEHRRPLPSIRNEVQEILWSMDASVPVPRKFRHEVSRSLDVHELYVNQQRFDELLESLFVLTNEWNLWGAGPTELRQGIDRHVYRNPGDWDVETLFDKLGAFDCSDRRFVRLLEGLASPEVRPDEAAQRAFVEKMNSVLNGCGAELREAGTDGGYPTFTVVSLGTNAGRPKNLIFASQIKPDLRFRDAVSNNVEVVTNADKVLIYDPPIGADGLRWAELQSWWADREKIMEPDQAKRTLYRRLQSCLPDSSPPQRFLFDTFFGAFREAIPRLPALLPEVWLHWDPKTVAERGVAALARHRMDFLLLLPGSVRVVLEVDGKTHYADDDGHAAPGRYATMAKADRELKLSGYELYRFGAVELSGNDGRELLREFFTRLFKRHGVVVP